jgi:protein gp37
MSKIEWTQETWNPLIGCSKVSPGCKNCYAIQTAWIRQHNPKMAERYAGVVEKTAGGSLNWTGKVNVVESVLEKPLKKKKPTMYFVNSMSDLFHEAVPFEVIDKVFAVMALCPQHTFQVLTKRPARMVEYFKHLDEDIEEIRQAAEIIVCDHAEYFHITKKLKGEAKEHIGPIEITSQLLPQLKQAGWGWDVSYFDHGKESNLVYEGELPFKNIWLGVSVENQKTANERIPLLLQVPAAVRFLSCEPLLGPVDLSFNVQFEHPDNEGYGIEAIKGVDWIIVGGESGNNARPMHPDWAQSLRDQCQMAGVAFFFKQFGEWKPFEGGDSRKPDYGTFKNNPGDWNDSPVGTFLPDVLGLEWGTVMTKVGKKKAGRLLDGREWNEFPGKKNEPVEDPDLHAPGFDY